MIEIKPSDFSTDALYTKMEELNGKVMERGPLMAKMNKDINSVEKYLKELKLTQSYYVDNLENLNANISLGWDNEDKRLMVANTKDYEQKPLAECKLDTRILCWNNLEKLLNKIILMQGV